jgi:hypothetical protein
MTSVQQDIDVEAQADDKAEEGPASEKTSLVPASGARELRRLALAALPRVRSLAPCADSPARRPSPAATDGKAEVDIVAAVAPPQVCTQRIIVAWKGPLCHR